MWCRVLLVDDELGVLNALRRELLRPPNISPEGLEIESFRDPVDALERARGEGGDFDLAVVDYRMPKLDGISLLREIHAIRPNAIRILMTGAADAAGIVKAINDAQIDVLLLKPWHEFDLKGRIALGLHMRALRRKRAEENSARPARKETYELMLVDDDRPVLAALEREIVQRGPKAAGGQAPLFRIGAHASAQEALESAAERSPDLVISDFAMPEMDGVTFLHRLRETCPDTVRMLMSGRSDVQMLVDAVNVAGIYHFLPKPWSNADLKSALIQALMYREFLGD